MVVSGGFGLNDWSVKPWWPFSQAEYVLPLIPWGDIGPTVIMMAGIILGAKRPDKLSRISTVTLMVLIAYLLVRGWSRGILT
jgi:purine-cytosine permease-like protein